MIYFILKIIGEKIIKKYLLSISLISELLFAQTIPDTDAIQRDIQKNIEKIQSENLKGISKSQLPADKVVTDENNISAVKSNGNEIKFILKSISFSGNTIIKNDDINQTVAQFLNREVSFLTLKDIITSIQRMYSDKGFIAKAYLPQQKIKDGNVNISIIEGMMGEISKNPISTSKIPQDSLQKYIQNFLKHETMLNTQKLAKAMKLINEQDGLIATSSISKGENNESIGVMKKTSG